jgi:hypothetical protein
MDALLLLDALLLDALLLLGKARRRRWRWRGDGDGCRAARIPRLAEILFFFGGAGILCGVAVCVLLRTPVDGTSWYKKVHPPVSHGIVKVFSSQTALDGRYIAGSGTFVSVEPKRWFHVETTIDSRVQTARNPALRQHWTTGHGGNIRANIHAVRISAGTQN